MDDQAQRCWYSPSGAERHGSKTMLRAAGHVDPGYVPPEHRVQSPTSGAWHPCQCSRGDDHVGATIPGDAVRDALAILAARGVELPDDPVLLVAPEGWFDLSDDPTLMSWPPKPSDWPDA
jgi:hypothetical protein